jgi:type I restriction enzyme M protein
MSEATSTTANRTLRRLSNATYRPREYLTEAEDIAAAIMGHLRAALDEVETVSEELETAIAEQEDAA